MYPIVTILYFGHKPNSNQACLALLEAFTVNLLTFFLISTNLAKRIDFKNNFLAVATLENFKINVRFGFLSDGQCL